MSEASSLELPGWLRAAVRDTPSSTVTGQSVLVNPRWWTERLDATPFVDELFEAPDERLTRVQLFQLGAEAGESARDARRLLWATLAWGTGRRHRHNRARLSAVEKGGDELSEVLRAAAVTSRINPTTAYRQLQPYRNAVAHLGPPFFTKFLYFAGGGSDTHPCLILDSMVARSLRRDCGWTSLTGLYTWPATEYAAYCELASRWAAELSADAGVAVRPDQIEYVLFRSGRPEANGGS